MALTEKETRIVQSVKTQWWSRQDAIDMLNKFRVKERTRVSAVSWVWQQALEKSRQFLEWDFVQEKIPEEPWLFEKEGFFEEVWAWIVERGEAIWEAEWATQVATEVLKWFKNVWLAIGKKAIEEWTEAIPEDFRNFVSENVKAWLEATGEFVEEEVLPLVESFWKAVLESDIGGFAVEEIEKAKQDIADFIEQNPEKAETINKVTTDILNLAKEAFWVAEVVTGGAWIIKWAKIITEVAGELWKKAIKKVVKTKTQKAIDIITPQKFSAKERARLISEWKIETWKGITWAREKFIPWVEEKRIAKNIEDFVSSKNSVSQNISSLNKSLTKLANETKEWIIKGWDRIFNTKTIFKKIDDIKIPEFLKKDQAVINQFNIVKDNMKRIIEENPKKLSWLLDARKQFDSFVKKQSKVLSQEQLSPLKSAVLDTRWVLNDFIADSLPKGNKFKQLLKQQSDIYKAVDLISPQTDINIIWKILKSPFIKAWIWAWAVTSF